MMNTGAFIHDLLDWIDNNLDSRLDIAPLPGEPAIRSGTSSGSSKNIPGYPRRVYSRAKAAKIG
jgi:AraC family transcriptional activator of mar-sox-rob regulon